MNFYLDSKEKKDCYSCTACATVCPVKCITMELDKSSGYFYPKVDKEKCINCGKCKNICINLQNKKLQNPINRAIILYNKNETSRLSSASGGISALLMEYIINRQGVVYGAKYNEELVVTHTRATSLEECEKFKTSKYVRSDINGIYKQVLEDLEKGYEVLFTGTPCQIAGLKAVVNENLRKKLLLCEIMCDNVASPLLFEKFKEAVERKYKKEIKNINFRSKANGAHSKSMCIEFKDKTSQILAINKNNLYSEYMQIFGVGLSAPAACLKCEFEHIEERTSDFTIGDYWGKKEILKDDNKGISFMLINSEKANEIFENFLKDKVIFQEVEIAQALDNNHTEPKKYILNKEKFMQNFAESSFEDLAKEYVRKYRWRTMLGKIIPKNFKEQIKKVLLLRKNK